MHNHPTPKFSIITVTYNAEAVLEDTIQSVISQTYHHVEYIIVDGASKDGTLSIIDRYKDRITRIVSEPDKGLYDAMNKGIRLATGDYLCFLNAGDSFHEDDTLQQMVHSISSSELPTCCMAKQRWWIRKGTSSACAASPPRKRLPGEASSRACWSAIRPSLPKLPLWNPTTCNTASPLTSIGASG